MLAVSKILNLGVESLLARSTPATLIVSSLCVATIAGYYYLQNVNAYWTKRGIRGPRPLPLLGNFLDFSIRWDRLKFDLGCVRQYGKVYGAFQGTGPRLVIADAELLTQICVKDFEAFPNHELAEFSSKYAHLTLIKLKDGHWKRTRALLSPTFSSGKIKRMFRFMDECASDLVACVAEQFSTQQKGSHPEPPKATIDVKDTYNLFAMDTITTCCYGLKLERGTSTNLSAVATRNEFIAKAMKVFEVPVLRTIIQITSAQWFLDLFNFKITSNSVMDPMANIVQRLVSQRRNSRKSLDDYLQSLVDARLDDELEVDELDLKESHHVGLGRESMLANQRQMLKDISGANACEEDKRVSLTDEEIIANAIFLLAVGIETTSSLLANCTYTLAFHMAVQERLHGELKKIAKYDNERDKYVFEYDSLTSCQYLDAVLAETLRRLPPVIMLDRVSNRDYYIEKYNVHLPAGSHLYLGFHQVQNDPDYWPEPERFDPERFMPGNRENIVPGSYCPFGLGPRHCIGMRFALTEAKLALAQMLMRYKFEPAPGKKFPPEPKMVLAICNFKEPLVTVLHRPI